MSRILFVASLLLLGAAGNLSSIPLNETQHPGAVVNSTEALLTEAANNSSEGATANSTGENSKAPKASILQPTGPPAMMVKPGQCPVVSFLVHASHNQPHNRHPHRGLSSKRKFKHGFSSSSSESGSYSKEDFGHHYHYYRHHGPWEHPNPCRAADCGMDGDCPGELKCCAVPGCEMKCLRPASSDQLPGRWRSPRRYVASPSTVLPP
ncbi:uncharacterized protein LOC125437035 [Sphaerodactylus townsendi]|uniref:Uncharacterized protein n=1 Tax=Sphaerodactylus townsendi TaxID=933632 RepID=A0ACB8ESK1_9SAUR|nr:uncharacterized protein LOC125437035 [Sphaerodactylus townsendi]